MHSYLEACYSWNYSGNNHSVYVKIIEHNDAK